MAYGKNQADFRGAVMLNSKTSIEAVLEREGVTLRQRGRHMWGLCPLHDERTPSFMVDPDRQRFKCFGCNEGGDVVDLVQKLHNLTFKDALKHLGMTPGKPPRVDQKQQRKRELLADFEAWRRETYQGVCDEYNAIWHGLRRCRNMDEIGEFAEVLCELGPMQDMIDVLSGKNEELQYELNRCGI